MSRRKTTDEFKQQSSIVHKGKYDYSHVTYVGQNTPVDIICTVHGKFSQTPKKHLQGHGCFKCHVELRRKSLNDFINQSYQIHNGKYQHFKNYNNPNKYVEVLCDKHGWFKQHISDHLHGCGCKTCSYELRSMLKRSNTEDFILKSNKIHNDYYQYDNTTYIDSNTELTITCPKHGNFNQYPYNHLYGYGCPKCGKEKISDLFRKDLETFINQANIVHNYVYDYSQVSYVNNKTNVDIVCQKHGVFSQTPNNHLNGNGCPKCRRSHLEIEVAKFLSENGINFIEQAKRKHIPWLGLQSLDFYLPDYNVAIECQGKQHFIEGCSFGGGETLETIQKRDQMKRQKCQENGVKLLYYSTLGIEYPYTVFEDKTELLLSIKTT